MDIAAFNSAVTTGQIEFAQFAFENDLLQGEQKIFPLDL